MRTARLLIAGACLLGPAAESARLGAFGEPLPPAAVARFGTLLWWHQGAPIDFLAYASEDKELLTLDRNDNTVRVWDVASGKQIRKIGAAPGPDKVVFTHAALTADRKTLVTAAIDDGPSGRLRQFLRFWDIATGTKKQEWKPPIEMAAFAVSPDGQTLAIRGTDQSIRLCRSADGKEIRKLGTPPAAGTAVTEITFTRDGKNVLAMCSDFQKNRVMVKRCDVETGKETLASKEPLGSFTVVTWAANGNALAWGGSDGVLHFWDIDNDRATATTPVGDGVQALALSPDGKTLVSRGHDHIMRVWNTSTAKEVRSLGRCPSEYNRYHFDDYGGPGFICPFAFTADGKYLGSATTGNTIRQWQVESGQELPPAGHRGPVDTIGISTDGATAITRADNGVHVWDIASGKELRSFTLPDSTVHVALSANAQAMVLGDQDAIRTWEAVSGKEIKQWPVHHPNGSHLFDLAVSPDGKIVAGRSYDQVIRLYDSASGRELRVMTAPAGIRNLSSRSDRRRVPGMVFSPDGVTLAALDQPPLDRMHGPQPAEIRIWDVHTARQVCKIELAQSHITSMTFSPDGHTLATGSWEDTLRLWEVASGKERFRFKTGKPGNLVLAYKPDGKTLLAAGSEGPVRFYSTSTGKELGHLQGHEAGVVALALAAKGRTLICGGVDTTALAFNIDGLAVEEPTVLMDVDSNRLETLWKELASEDSRKAYQAMQALASARQTLQLLRERVRPMVAPDPKRVAELIADIEGDKPFAVRQRATEELEKLGELAADALKKVLDAKPGLEVQSRVERLLDRLASPAEAAARLGLFRAVELLERIGSAEAQQILDALSKGAPGTRLTREAGASLRRLK